MSEANSIKRLGRVEYIEPNNLFVNSEGNKIQNGIPQPYEDYSFSVNLRVINGNRYDCGMPDDYGNSGEDVVEFSSTNGTLSFMDGTSVNGEQGYLTTNFTDISMNDPNTNTKECLGIESISIKYDSWFYPTVDIRFIDVRGASLMQPAEYEYYNNGRPNGEQRGPVSNSDFFKAFFSFPYPLFRLSVKGFYGKEVTYDLSVLKCNVEFNSSTGNFEVSASFIGYMYGMYADLPFTFPYLAPYIDLDGKNTWDEKIHSGDFCYLTTDDENPVGSAMYTFPELKRAVEEASHVADKVIEESTDGKHGIELEKLYTYIEKSILPNSPTSTSNYTWWSWSKTKDEKKAKGYFFVSVDDNKETRRKIFNDFYKFSSAITEYNKMAEETEFYKDRTIVQKDVFEKIYSSANSVSKSKGTNGKNTAVTEYTDSDINNILSNKIVFLKFHKDSKNKEKPIIEVVSGHSGYEGLIDELKKRFYADEMKSPMHKSMAKSDWTFAAFEIYDIKYINAIIDILNDLKKEFNEFKVKIDKLREQSIDSAIGFKPTIKNLYNMIFAHIDTFMTVFYNMLNRIKQKIQDPGDQSREFLRLCGGNGNGQIQTDVNENTLNTPGHDGKLPPFTMFYKEETEKDSKDRKMVMVWPGSLTNGKDLDEVKLVESIINATALNKRPYETVTPKNNVIRREGDLAPINYYDIIRWNGNPYCDILNKDSIKDGKIVQDVLRVFILRCFYSMLDGSFVSSYETETKDASNTSASNFTKKAKLIAKLEVGNIERAFKGMKPSQNFIVKLLGLSNDGKNIIDGYLTGDKPIFSTNGAKTDLFYKWMPKYDSDGTLLYNFLPVGIFEPTRISNYASGANLKSDADKFLKISPNGTTTVNGDYACRIYSGGKKLENYFGKYSSGDFASSAKLFKNYKKLPSSLANIGFWNGTFSGDSKIFSTSVSNVSLNDIYDKIGDENSLSEYVSIPSLRKTSAGITSIFMDPLYYSQKDTESSNATEARAYLFLMGIPFGEKCDFFLPEYLENGDYPTLLLLREGAVYWRNSILFMQDGQYLFDPITYKYVINGTEYDALQDIEHNDPRFGRANVVNLYSEFCKNSSAGRRQILIDYFLKWANGIEVEAPSSITEKAMYEKPEIPSVLVDFQTLERNLALWEYNGTINRILSKESCDIAASSEYVSSFSNSYILKEIYNVGIDGKLGKANKTIRTDVFMRGATQNSGQSNNANNFIDAFKKFFIGFDTLIDFSCINDAENGQLSVPRSAMNDAVSAFIGSLKESCKITSDMLKSIAETETAVTSENEVIKPEQFKDDNLKLACYIALKNIYDRWICSRRRESWYFSCNEDKMNQGIIKSDFSRFFYVDEFYHNIGMQLRPDLTNFVSQTSKLGGFTEKSNEENLAATSIIKILSMTAQYGGCSLLTLPITLGLAKGGSKTEQNTIEDVFKAFPYNEAARTGGIESSFIVLYSSQKSSILNIPDDKGKMGYKTDGFDIADTWGEIVPQPMLCDSDEDGYLLKSFGVTFAKQNQSYFKDVKLSMEDHQITEYSVRNELMISYQSNQGPRETSFMGQNLYSVYSNYSYSCSVSMMGDAQITPLMYFQLNNIAMWKGAYMITNVHHNITVRGMETQFTGVRQARPSLPFKGDKMDIAAGEAPSQTPYSQEDTMSKNPHDESLDISDRPLDRINVDDVDNIVFIINRTAEEDRESERWVSGLFSVRVKYNNGDVVNYTDHALTLEALYGLTEKIEDSTPDTTEAIFSLPKGRFSGVLLVNASDGEEYRSSNDSFYEFTDKKHMVITDSRLGSRKSEIITGETKYDTFESGGFKEISFGGASPVMLYPNSEDINKQYDKTEIQAIYAEVFRLVKRMNEAKKPLSVLINEGPELPRLKKFYDKDEHNFENA